METVLIVIHLMVVTALVILVLLQKSEGGALGMGGSGDGFMSTRSAGNVLTRATGFFAFVFFATSILLTILASTHDKPGSILQQLPGAAPAIETDPDASILDQLGGQPSQNTGNPPQPTNDKGQPAN
jgi:preprotein translocase subunit SecG